MDRLIDNLLKLSRVTRAELQRQTVSLSEVSEQIIAELRKAEPEREVEVVIQPGLSAQGDEAPAPCCAGKPAAQRLEVYQQEKSGPD